MIYGYLRVSKMDQHLESQKSLIARYVVDHKMIIDEWIQVEISSRKSVEKRRITELLDKVETGYVVIVSEISRVGRSIKEVLQIIEELIQIKKCRLVLVKQGLDLDPTNQNDITNKILLTIFTMMAELERDFISERTKEGLKARKESGIILGKPIGIIQKSMYDKDKDKIESLYQLGVPINTIINTHLKYGGYLSLKYYIGKRISKKSDKKNKCLQVAEKQQVKISYFRFGPLLLD
jgi:DNA invertase Pin-like site-specific DNA recombinase